MTEHDERDTAGAVPAVISTSPSFEAIDPQLAQLLQRAQEYYSRGKAQATREAYQTDWHDFTDWCATHHLTPLPAAPATVAVYLTASIERGQKVNTLARRLAAISHVHQAMGYATPTTTEIVRAVLIGIRRTHGKAPRGAGALMTEDIRRITAILPDTPVGLRDKSLILLGFAGAFRRSELIAMNIEDLHERDEGLVVLLRRSKTDQEGRGRLVGIPFGQHEQTCPVQAVRAWLACANITNGAIFRGMNRHGQMITSRLSPRAVGQIIKRSTTAAGLDPSCFSSHSLRVGHCTTAARAGISERIIMAQTGHTTDEMVRRYIRQGGIFVENSASSLGL